MKLKSIILIGAGNVAHHLGAQLQSSGFNILQVFSRKMTKARRLAKRLKSEAINDLATISPQADLYILAVHDSAIALVAHQLPKAVREKKLVVHTSGATPSTVFKSICKRYGIFYPLQTFSIHRAVDFSTIPICTHANRKGDRQALQVLGKDLSQSSFEIDDAQRAILHIAAVFVNNFSNHLFSIGAELCEKEQIPFSLLLPLILETASKVQKHSPAKMQTGPALRGDSTTLHKHLDYLQQYPEYEKIYRQLSKNINPKLPL